MTGDPTGAAGPFRDYVRDMPRHYHADPAAPVDPAANGDAGPVGWFRDAIPLGSQTAAVLAAEILAKPPRSGRTRIVAIDGQSGAGKTTFAAELAAAVLETGATVEVVHTDDLLDGWDDQFTFWERLSEQVLEPLRAGRAARYHRYDWIAERFVDEVTVVHTADVVIVEGVSTARAAMRLIADLTAFLGVPDDLAWERLKARDPVEAMPFLRVWKEREARHFAADRTAELADVLITGGFPRWEPRRPGIGSSP